jgi:CO/xanthine dehydrogenase Mo-binding subunit
VTLAGARVALPDAPGLDRTDIRQDRGGAAVCERLRASGGRIAAEGLDAEDEVLDPTSDPNHGYSIHSYGTQFAEVGVDIDTGEIRLRRMHGVLSGGRIRNAKTASSQLISGMIWQSSRRKRR